MIATPLMMPRGMRHDVIARGDPRTAAAIAAHECSLPCRVPDEVHARASSPFAVDNMQGGAPPAEATRELEGLLVSDRAAADDIQLMLLQAGDPDKGQQYAPELVEALVAASKIARRRDFKYVTGYRMDVPWFAAALAQQLIAEAASSTTMAGLLLGPGAVELQYLRWVDQVVQSN